MTVSLATQNLERLRRLYAAGYEDDFTSSALHKIISRQIERDEADLARVDDVLAEFEVKYEMNSDEFWRLFQAGQAADTADFMEWNAFFRMQQRLLSRLSILHRCWSGRRRRLSPAMDGWRKEDFAATLGQHAASS